MHAGVDPRAELAHCVGYRVDSFDGRIGSVAVVLPSGDAGGYLLVQSGLMTCRLTTIPVSQVEEVDSERRRVRLRDMPATSRGTAQRGVCDRIVGGT
jgi:hypothetical protein